MEGFPHSEEPKELPAELPVADPVIQEKLESLPLQVAGERYADFPNRRQALRGKDSENLTVFLSHAIAQKLYRCPCCSGDIPIGSEHVIMSRVQMSKKYTHHHVDFTCTQAVILPSLTTIEKINPQDASASAVNKRARRFRNKHR
ncbi:MAG: hypothetical protein JWS12_540 [Candidatus Saccharibacteria bacterium]|nr:hypothetical protein [Candidatus Saccharibacteria bacterium]